MRVYAGAQNQASAQTSRRDRLLKNCQLIVRQRWAVWQSSNFHIFTHFFDFKNGKQFAILDSVSQVCKAETTVGDLWIIKNIEASTSKFH